MEVKRTIEPNVFYKAEAFHIAAKLLHENDLLHGRGGPFIVNAMFSLELYLKSILSITIFNNGREYADGVMQYDSVHSKSKHNGNGHDLFSLFSQLPETTKLELDALLTTEHNTISLSDFFNKYKNHFVEWRYSFEGNAKSYSPYDILQILHM